MKLYDLPRDADPAPRIYGMDDGEGNPIIVHFRHIDGMYSLCYAHDAETGERLGPCHLAAWTPLEPEKDGWKIAFEEEDARTT